MFWLQRRAWRAGLLTSGQVITGTKAGMRREADTVIQEVAGVESTGPG